MQGDKLSNAYEEAGEAELRWYETKTCQHDVASWMGKKSWLAFLTLEWQI